MKRLNGKVAVVTGASKGIGAAIATAFGAAGARVVVNYASDKAGADRVVAEIMAQDGKAVAVQGDVSKAADVKRLFAETKRQFGGLDILVNNAAVYAFQPLEELTEAEFHRQFGINVLGPLLAAREALPYFRNGGSIINVSSVVTDNPPASAVIYASTKGAMDTMTRALARELGARGIRVNTLAPGGVDTEGSRAVGMIGSDFEKQIVAATSLGRIGRPADITGAALFLASDESAWVTGDRISASGGWR